MYAFKNAKITWILSVEDHNILVRILGTALSDINTQKKTIGLFAIFNYKVTKAHKYIDSQDISIH